MQASDSKIPPPAKAASGKVMNVAHLFQGGNKELAEAGLVCTARRKPGLSRVVVFKEESYRTPDGASGVRWFLGLIRPAAGEHDFDVLQNFMRMELEGTWEYFFTQDDKPMEFTIRSGDSAETMIKRILVEVRKRHFTAESREYIDELKRDIAAGAVHYVLDPF